MKGTFFSADFVVDQNDNARLLEINTDTQVYADILPSMSFQPLIDVLTANSSSINEFHVVYKENIHKDFEAKLSQSIADNCSWINTYTQYKTPADSIYPTNPTDSGSRFILRCAYNENAILDSTYAKGTLNTCTLMIDNNATSSVAEIYHSSSTGLWNNLLDAPINSQSNVPHVVSKRTTEQTHDPMRIYTMGSSSATNADRYTGLIHTKGRTDFFFQRYYISNTAYGSGKAKSIRSYHITYGSDLDVITLASGEQTAILDLPTSINKDDSTRATLVNYKHFYEFTTKPFITNADNGILGEEGIQLQDLTWVSASAAQTGSVVRSYHIPGLPDSDSESVIDAWEITGSNQLPAGGYYTTASIDTISSKYPKSQHLIELIDDNGDAHEYGGRTRLLVHDSQANKIHFLNAEFLTDIHSLVQVSGSHLPISYSNYAILDSQEKFYDLDVETEDIFFTKTGLSPKVVVAHNIVTGKAV